MIAFVYKKIDLGYEDLPFYPSEHTFSRHMHNSWEFYFLKTGNVSYTIESGDYTIIPNDMLIIPPRHYHMFRKNESDRYGRFTLNFYEDMFPPFITDILKKLNRHYRIPRNGNINVYFNNLIKYNELLSKDEMYFFVKNCIELTILDLYYNEENRVITGNDKDDFFTDVVNFINDNISKPISVEDICNRFFVSKSLVFHKFKSKFNISIIQYVNLRKILYAQNLIFSGTPAMEACFRVGFQDYSSFYRQYKKFLKTTPEQDKKLATNSSNNDQKT